MVIVGFVLVLGFGAVITNLVRLQLVNGETLKTDAVDQSLQSTQLTPSRGTIYDATGTKVLAQSASVWTVALEPNYIDEGDDVKIAKGLSEILGLDYDAVLKKAQRMQSVGSNRRASSAPNASNPLFCFKTGSSSVVTATPIIGPPMMSFCGSSV